MRHGDYRTTLKHYTVLGLTDTAGAVAALPSIEAPRAAAATAKGTDANPQQYRQQCTQHYGRKGVRANAGRRGAAGAGSSVPGPVTSGSTRSGATMCGTTAGVAQLVERQPSKLNVDGSSPFARYQERGFLLRTGPRGS